MSSTHLSNDPCAYNVKINQSVGPLTYTLDPHKFHHVNACRHKLGLIQGPAVSHVPANMLDVENELLGLHSPMSKCPSYKHMPTPSGIVKKPDFCGKEYPTLNLNPSLHLPPCQYIGSYNHVPFPKDVSTSSCYARVDK